MKLPLYCVNCDKPLSKEEKEALTENDRIHSNYYCTKCRKKIVKK